MYKTKIWSNANRAFRSPFGIVKPGVNEFPHDQAIQLLKIEKVVSLYEEKETKNVQPKTKKQRINRFKDDNKVKSED